MPRISPTGEVVQGLGLVWWKPVVSQELIGQREQPDGSWAVSTAPTTAGPWTVLDPRGCNFIAAGGSNWAAFGGTIFGPAAVPGAAIPAGLDGRGNGAHDGTILLVKNSETGGLILKRLTGPDLEIPDAWPTSNACVIDRDRALWVDARGGVRTCGGLPVPVTLPGPVLWPSVFWAQEQWWIAYHSTDAIGYVCHPFSGPTGYRIATIPAFYPNAVALSNDTARFAWSVDPAESPAGLRVWNQDLTAQRLPVWIVVPPEPPIVPPVDFPPLFPGVPMQTEQGWLIGPGDKALSCDAAGVVTYTNSALTDTDLVQLDPIDGDRRGTYRPVAHPDLYLTGDATQFAPTGNVCNQVQGLPSALAAPGGVPGWYQRWDVGQWPSGLVSALVPYIEQGAANGRIWASASLTWVKKS